MKPSPKAENLNRQGLELKKKGDLEGAAERFRKATEVAPRWAVAWYHLGLMLKHLRRWQECLDCNRRATELDPSDKAAWWNMGIAATAVADWSAARAAWRGFGAKEVPGGDGPLDLPCGFCPIRINPTGDAEVVWANRIDPARAEIVSIPFPESGHRWGDIVLNDGAPNGYRRNDGKDVPVFDALQMLEPSIFSTFIAKVHLPPKGDHAERLAEIADRLRGCAEDWSTSIRMICKACSEGRPHAAHDKKAAPPSGVHNIALAARDRTHAEKMLAEWQAALTGIEVESLEEGRTGD
jgi:tetratricopeptide (TPR) repeat protein